MSDLFLPGPKPEATLRLHPNLARIAVEYNDIYERYYRHEIDVVEANKLIRELVARDDDGVLWCINPRDGGWMYKSVSTNKFVPAAPPDRGLASLTAFDVSDVQPTGPSRAVNPDQRLRFEKAELSQDGLQNSSRRAAESLKPVSPRSRRPLLWILVAVVVVLGLWAFSKALNNDTTPQPVSTTFVVQTTVVSSPTTSMP